MKKKKLKKKIVKYRKGLREIEEAETMVRKQIVGERHNPPTDSSEHEEKYRQAKTELEEIKAEIKSRKSKINEWKSQIRKMKNDFEKTPAESKPEGWAKLSAEIKPLSDKIIESESAISALEMRRFSAEQVMAQAEIMFEAFKGGYHKKPIENDPRLKVVLKERKRIKKKLKRAEK